MTIETPETVRRDRLTFYPVVLMSTVFCVSIFIVIAATFGERTNPVNAWINRHANLILLAEAGVLFGLSILAMTLDRLRTLKQLAADGLAAGSAQNPIESGDAVIPREAESNMESLSEQRNPSHVG